ncbi:hypothetical protein BDV24DRAFT_138088 [Aspergillus arachidicola]|uniref:Uncharacterized protein n=1 Tax=Aspergillus arachidicola TaxID=656916 RepID=A0A5N6Y1M3_9EURO|nr:hypothetical protein BDV24DRAFT_138088 [Aspergillus arachidicola]
MTLSPFYHSKYPNYLVAKSSDPVQPLPHNTYNIPSLQDKDTQPPPFYSINITVIPHKPKKRIVKECIPQTRPVRPMIHLENQRSPDSAPQSASHPPRQIAHEKRPARRRSEFTKDEIRIG